MPPQPLTNFEIQIYYQNEPRLNSVYSRKNLSEVWDVYDKSWWLLINMNSLDSILCEW